MGLERPLRLLIACSERVRNTYFDESELRRLERIAEWRWVACEGGGIYDFSQDDEARARLGRALHDREALIVCSGAPCIDAELLDQAPNLRFLGELEGDRFASRIDLPAAWARNLRVVDTTNGSSYPVAEWALGLILICMRNGGAHFRRMINGDTARDGDLPMAGTLTGKRVGMIGCGHMGRRLLSLLRPFDVECWVHDPYLPHEMAEVLGFVRTGLRQLLSSCDVIVSVVPHTPATEKLIDAEALACIRAGSVFVNVSRGAVVDSAALIERLKKGDIYAGLDVFDPEPVPVDSPILKMSNVFLSPHIGWYDGEPYPRFFPLMVDELERFVAGHETYFDLTPRTRENRSGRGSLHD